MQTEFMENSEVLYKNHYEIFADYHQFYLMDAKEFTEFPTDYMDEDVERRIKAEQHIVVIQPERNMNVPVEMEILASALNNNFDEWQNIAEASLELPSGKLQIEECCGETKDIINLDSGFYRIRAYYGDLDKLSFDGLEGDDHYKIVIWQAPFEGVKVLKQYTSGHGFE